MTTAVPPTAPLAVGRATLTGRVLLAICAVGAVAAGVTAVSAVTGADDATLIVEAWRMAGFFVFAGTFALLAYRPRSFPGVFELAIGHKLVLTLVALTAGSADGAGEAAAADGILTVLLLAAYGLCRSWTAWDRLR